MTCVYSSRATLPNTSLPCTWPPPAHSIQIFITNSTTPLITIHHGLLWPVIWLGHHLDPALHQGLVKNSIKAHLSHCTTPSCTIKAFHPRETLPFLPLLFTNPQCLSKAPTLPLLLTNSTLSTSPVA